MMFKSIKALMQSTRDITKFEGSRKKFGRYIKSLLHPNSIYLEYTPSKFITTRFKEIFNI